MKTLMVFVLMVSGMMVFPLASQAQDPDNEMKMDFNPEMFKMNQGTGRTSISPYWGFGPTFVTSNIEVVGYEYPEFKPFSSWSNDLGIMLRTRLGGKESKFHLFYGVLWRYINIETDNSQLGVDVTTGNAIYFTPTPDADNTELNIHTLSVPLLLEYKGKVSFALGGFAAYHLCSSSETDYKSDQRDQFTTIREDFGLNDLLYGVTGQIGIKRARVYVNYYLNNIFADDSPYDFTVMNIGIAFM